MLSPNAISDIVRQQVPAGGTGYSCPIPVRESGALRVLVLIYHRSHSRRSRDIFPPHEALVLDPETGNVIERRARPLGPAVDLRRPLPAPSPRPKRDPDAWSAAEARFNTIAPKVWAAYAAQSSDKALRATAADYRAQLAFVELPEIVPLHASVGRDFNEWMKRITEAP